MKDFSRVDRLSSQISRELSAMLIGFTGLPAGLIISITDIELSRDLRYAKVFYSVFGDDEAIQKADRFFKDFNKQIRQELASRIRIKFMPELHFEYDNSIERGQRINELLNRIKEDEQPD
jgi:ribosome-binding factor A